MDKKKVVVIGAVNIDICGTSDEQLILYDSNPGHAGYSFGGVGRNIAENMCRLGAEVHMITALADDVFTKDLLNYSKAVGISFDHSMIIPGAGCSKYICINNNNGDMILAVSDMKIYDLMTVDFISGQMDFINSCDLAVVDTNIPQEVIEYICEHATIPVAADPVSVTKAEKLRKSLGGLTIVKPNMFEAESLTGIKIENDDSLVDIADFFHKRGIKYVFVSMAEEGVFYSDGNESGTVPICKKQEVVNVSGCGDTFLSAVLSSYLNNQPIRKMAMYGECAASICANSPKTVCENINDANITDLMSYYN